MFVQSSNRGGISGNKEIGCDAIVVSRQDPSFREMDELTWILFTSTNRQRAGALYRNFETGNCLRLFRSSALTNKFRPPDLDPGTQYRYDGLYKTKRVWDGKGQPNPGTSAKGKEAYTYLLERDEGKCQLSILELCENCIKQGTLVQFAFQMTNPPRGWIDPY
jgi:hypothetical protein